MNFWEAILKLDRRWVFLVLTLVVAVPIIRPLNLKVTVTPEVRGVFDVVESLPEGSPILLAFDYEPGSIPECEPMSIAILRHCFRKHHRVVGMTILPVGVGTGEAALAKGTTIPGMNIERGKDFTFLGFKAERSPSIIGMSLSVQNTFPTDRYGNDTSKLPVLKGVRKLSDFAYMIEIHDDSILEYWVMYGHEAVGLKVGSACTAVIASGIYPYLNAGQITGIVGGLKGASEYEKLLDYRGRASSGMDSQAVMHMFLIFLMIMGNIAHLMTRRKSARRNAG